MASENISLSPFDRMQRMTFGGNAGHIPFKTYRVKGAQRKHVHDYPRNDYSAVEKLGRSLYEITVTADFHGDLDTPEFQGTKDQLNVLGSLRVSFNLGRTDFLTVPHIGPFPVFCDEWTEDVHGTDRSGVMVEMKFIEDVAAFSLPIIPTEEASKLRELSDTLVILAEPLKKDIFSTINTLAIQISAFFDQPQLYSSLIAAKVDSFTQFVRHTHNQTKELMQPEYWEIREALMRLHDAGIEVRNDIMQRGDFLREFTVPLPMSVSQVANAIYGDYTRGGEIMQLNILPDPLRIEAGTRVHYYKAA